MEVRIELCTSARVYRKDSTRRIILTSLLVVLYGIAIPFCYNTAGEPRKTAMIHAQKLADEKWALESSSVEINGTLADSGELVFADIDMGIDSSVLTSPETVDEDEEVNFGSDG